MFWKKPVSWSMMEFMEIMKIYTEQGNTGRKVGEKKLME